MDNARLLSLLSVVASATLLILALLLNGSARWLMLFGFLLLVGISLGTLLGRRFNPSGDGANSFRARKRHVNGFAAELLEATINEMREGLLVIDNEMRVVASNQAARDL